MISVRASVAIGRPAGRVFKYLSNLENNPAWQSGMRHARFTSDPPLRVGSTYEQEARFLGRRIVSTFEVTGLVPGESISIASTGGSFPIQVTRRVESISEFATRVTADISGQTGRMFWVASPLLRWIVQRSVNKDYANLKRVLEA